MRMLLTGLVAMSIFTGGVWAQPAGRLYAAASNASEVYVIDTSTNEIIDRVEVGTHPHGLAITSDGRWLWVAVEGDGRIVKSKYAYRQDSWVWG